MVRISAGILEKQHIQWDTNGKNKKKCRAPVALACNHSYSGGRDLETLSQRKLHQKKRRGGLVG
jgi:hypothetical protein